MLPAWKGGQSEHQVIPTMAWTAVPGEVGGGFGGSAGLQGESLGGLAVGSVPDLDRDRLGQVWTADGQGDLMARLGWEIFRETNGEGRVGGGKLPGTEETVGTMDVKPAPVIRKTGQKP